MTGTHLTLADVKRCVDELRANNNKNWQGYIIVPATQRDSDEEWRRQYPNHTIIRGPLKI